MHKLKAHLLFLFFLCGLLSFGIARIAYGQGLFERNLRLGDRGEDVQRLQTFLNTHGAPVATTGVGSVGKETMVFGQKTQQAVAAFQELHRTKILAPTKLARGTGNFYAATREVVNELVKQAPAQAEETPATIVAFAQDPASSNNQSRQLTYVVGGTVTGLTQPVRIHEASGETLTIQPGASANFVFSRAFSSGDHYQVTAVSAVPGRQVCYVSKNGAGTVGEGPILNIQVQCTSNLLGDPFRSFAGLGTESYVLGGTVSGLSGTVVLRASTGESLALTSNGSFTFGSRISRGALYTVTVQTNPTSPDQTCTVTNGSGMMTGTVTNVSVTCVANTTTLSASVGNLALSIAGLVGAPSSGSPRVITITNTGASTARGIGITSPTWPTGTVSNTTCDDTLAAAASCTITITPGGTATSDGTSPCSGGTAPVPGTIQVTADNAGTVSTNVVILGYGCIYQDGYVFSVDDSTPSTQSIGGTVAALENQSAGMVWGSNGTNASTVSYDIIPGIGQTSASTSSAPTFADFSSYFGGTYAGVLGLASGDFSSCDGKTDGQCNTNNIVAFYNHYQTNYGVGGAPYTPVVAATAKSYYAAGVCDDYDSGDHQDWYLPAICEVTFDYPEIRAETAGCGIEASPLMQTMMQNLFFNGIGNFTSAQGIWSSSQYMYNNPETYAWNALVWPTAFPGGGDKSDLAQVRCVRSLTY